MKCPHCNDEVQLTWRRYLASPFGKHTCPVCREAFRLKLSLKYFVFIVSLGVVLGLIFFSFVRMWGYGIMKMLPYYLFLCVVFLMWIDRWFDAHHREIVPIKRREG